LRGRWSSGAVFEATTQAPSTSPRPARFAGATRTADPFGLLWSLERDPASAPLAGFAGPSGAVDVELAIEVDGATADRVRIRRGFMGPGIAREPVRDDGLVGTFFAPADGTARPGVLVVGGSDGGLSEGMAALLASHGFAALALAYFRAEHLPPDLTEIPLEYFETAIRWLGRQRERGGGRSRRGRPIARRRAGPAARRHVPRDHGGGRLRSERRRPRGHCRLARRGSRTALGLDLPRETAALRAASDRRALPRAAAASPEAPLELTPMFLKCLEDRAAVEAAAIAVERIRGPVLLISGEDDRLWPSPVLAEIAAARLAAHTRG
jgi:dienelactone hydrolase